MADRLTGISHVKGGSTTIASVSYTLDDVGNRTQRVDQQGTHTYAYDDLYRLTSVTYPGPSTTTYAFDAFGNRTSMTVGADETTYAYDDADRLTTVTPPSPASAVSYTWDDNGSLTNRGSDTFAWDYEERMVSATVNSVTTTVAYRGDGLRDSRTTGANTTTFTWDIAAGLPVVIDDGAQYVYGAGLEAQFSGANTYYYLADGLGSTMKTVDGSGNVVNSYTYDVYGKKTSSSGSQANEFDFAGQQTDPTGLQYLRARYMDPETGTFISREPMAIEHTWLGNPHSYGAAAPTTTTDPTGLEPRACARFNWCFHSSIDGIGPQHWWEWSPLRDTNVYRVCAFAGGQKWCSPADSLGFDQDSINGANWEQFVDMILAIASPGSGSSPGRHNYRKGLEDRTNFRPSTKEYHAHHVIPQKFREQLRATINIDDPRYLEWWDAPGHRAIWKA